MKFFTYTLAVAALIASTDAAAISSLRRHKHHPSHNEFVYTLPDVRPDTVTEEDIAAHESARSEAAKVKKNPQAALLASMKTDLEQINKDMSFGISFSQTKRNDHARELCTKVGAAIEDYESGPNDTLTEQNEHNISAVIFYDVQLQDAMKGLGMPGNGDLVLAVNRLKSLQKLYIFEQKGGENYLG